MGLGKAVCLGNHKDGCLPEILRAVVEVQTLADILSLADVDDGLGCLFGVTEQEIDRQVIEFGAGFRCDKIAAGNQHCLHDAGREFGDSDATGFPGG